MESEPGEKKAGDYYYSNSSTGTVATGEMLEMDS
jgi:hypothetical protein